MKKLLALALAGILCLSAAACAPPATPVPTGDAQPAADAPTAPAKKKTFAICYPIVHPFFEGTTRGAEDAAKAMGNVEVIVKAPDKADVQGQIEILENLIAMGVDGIALGPADPDALTPLIDKAVDKGIPVVCFDSDAPKSKRLGFIGTNNINAGRNMGDVLGKTLNGKGKVLCSMGVTSQLNLQQRLDGVKAILAEKYPEIEIVDTQSGAGDPNKTLANIEDMVAANPDFDALIGIDAAAGPAAVIVWKGKGLTQPVITFDDTDDIIQGVRDGQITTTIAQKQYAWGENAVKELMDAANGKQIPLENDTGTTEVTKDNVDEMYPSK